MNKPTKCPVCGKDYLENPIFVNQFNGINILVNRCSFCHEDILLVYKTSNGPLILQYPTNSYSSISNEIRELSPNFITCYEESLKAISYNLINIVGPGLRKSLEYLVTDYLTKIQKEQAMDKLKLYDKIALLDKSLYATASANIARIIGNDYTHIENLNGVEIQELIDNIELTAELMTTRLKAIKAEKRLNELKAQNSNS